MPWPTTTIVCGAAEGVVGMGDTGISEASVVGEQVEQGHVGGERFVFLPGAGERADRGEIAEQHPAREPVAAHDDRPVRAPGGVGEADHVVTGQRPGLAERGQVQPWSAAPVEPGSAG